MVRQLCWQGKLVLRCAMFHKYTTDAHNASGHAWAEEEHLRNICGIFPKYSTSAHLSCCSSGLRRAPAVMCASASGKASGTSRRCAFCDDTQVMQAPPPATEDRSFPEDALQEAAAGGGWPPARTGLVWATEQWHSPTAAVGIFHKYSTSAHDTWAEVEYLWNIPFDCQ